VAPVDPVAVFSAIFHSRLYSVSFLFGVAIMPHK